ncbi:MAG: penicillin-binding protein 2 [Pseudomonadota bacterium]
MNRRRRQSVRMSRGRFYVVIIAMAAAVAVLIARAADVQLLRNDFYQDQGNARHVRQVPIVAVRGAILDRNGEPLAISSPIHSVWGNPAEMLRHPDRLVELARALGMSSEALARRIGQRAEREFVYIRRHVAPDLAETVAALEIPGVSLEREYRRYYPAGEATSHVLGMTDIDERGQEGLELAFNEWLSGASGMKRVVKDLYGRTIENVELVQQPRQGRDLVTTVDRRLQYLAYRALKAGVAERGARSGSVVALDVRSGEVLAMANVPSYNPNDRSRSPGESIRNRAVTDFFEPGSVIKPFTVAAALESGRYRRDTVVHTSPGFLKVGAYTIRDFRDYGDLDLTGILTKSSNVGASKLALNLEAGHLWDAYKRFGFGEVSGSGFPGESPGLLPHFQRWREVEQAAISYGYGLSTTPLQLAQAYAAIANRGRIRAPTFVKGALNPDSAVIDPTLANRLVEMMETVTGDLGTGTRAAVPNYRVAGKTGTSRKAADDGYDDRYVATFAGFAPASDPQIVVVVSVNDPATEEYGGGQVAAPVFREVMQAALRLTGIAPDNLMEDEPVRATNFLAGGQP